MPRPTTRHLYLLAITALALGAVATCVGGAVYERRQFAAELLPHGATLLAAHTFDGHHVIACRAADSKLRVAMVHPQHSGELYAGAVRLDGHDLMPTNSRDPSRLEVEWFDFSIDTVGEVRVRVQEELHNQRD